MIEYVFFLVRFVGIHKYMPLTPNGDAASQGALNGAAVELFEDLRARAKYFQPPEGEEALSCSLHDCVGMFGLEVRQHGHTRICKLVRKLTVDCRIGLDDTCDRKRLSVLISLNRCWQNASLYVLTAKKLQIWSSLQWFGSVCVCVSSAGCQVCCHSVRMRISV
jgi:hypothetical protein